MAASMSTVSDHPHAYYGAYGLCRDPSDRLLLVHRKPGSVQDVADSNKLMKLVVDFGDHTRSILAGIKKERATIGKGLSQSGMALKVV